MVNVFRLLGLLGGLAAVTDLGTGSAPDESLCRCVVAARLARAAAVPEAVVSQVVYVSLLQHIGCTAYAHESAGFFGDDVAATRLQFLINDGDPRDLVRMWVPGMAAATGRSRARILAATVRSLPTAARSGPVATCEVARDAARKLQLPGQVVECLGDVLTTWHGKGYPPRSGDEIAVATRLMHVASVAVRFHFAQGPDAAIDQVQKRAGRELDPDLADVFLTRPDEIASDLDSIDAYDAALACEPDPVRRVDAAELAPVARTFGEVVDLKSPTLQGHSGAVADTAAAAGRVIGLDDEPLRVAGYLHDVGRVAVSSRIWDKTGPLSATERDQVNLHPYHGERIVARVPELAGLAPLIGRHHERCDGSGYHRGLTGDRMTMAERVLAAADAYRELVEDRPGAPRMTASDAARRLRDEARHGRYDGEAVEAVLGAAGHLRRTRPSRPAGLTERQVEVLRLMAIGMSNRAIADRLVISPRTAEHHVQDVYTRIGASSRAAAALFAMEYGLVGEHG